MDDIISIGNKEYTMANVIKRINVCADSTDILLPEEIIVEFGICRGEWEVITAMYPAIDLEFQRASLKIETMVMRRACEEESVYKVLREKTRFLSAPRPTVTENEFEQHTGRKETPVRDEDGQI